jgi:hypothetical protein
MDEVPKCSSASAGEPVKAAVPPRDSTTTRSHVSTSGGLWVVSTVVVPLSARPRNSAITSAAVAGSRPEVGSSRKSAVGLVSSSTAMLARLRSPPLSEPTRWYATGSRSSAARTHRTRASISPVEVPGGSRSLAS